MMERENEIVPYVWSRVAWLTRACKGTPPTSLVDLKSSHSAVINRMGSEPMLPVVSEVTSLAGEKFKLDVVDNLEEVF